ncbi:MAG: hypothetical protein HZB16_14745 [Armatimonadetes bacterium]|nr:hypothetical protein [Armatimonadota bacterium]
MDWQMFPGQTVQDAQSYPEPHIAELAALSLVTYPRPRRRLAAKLSHLVGSSLATFTLAPRSCWLQVPDFLMRHESDRK